jgi:hypothetical protein
MVPIKFRDFFVLTAFFSIYNGVDCSLKNALSSNKILLVLRQHDITVFRATQMRQSRHSLQGMASPFQGLQRRSGAFG